MNPQTEELTRQLEIIHISDLHFGDTHIFRTPNSPDGDIPKDDAYPTLAQKIKEDLDKPPTNCSTVVCLTGDFVDKGKVEEYTEAEQFLQDLLGEGPLAKHPKDCIFLIPGNHDVDYTSDNLGIRFRQYIEFYNRFYGTNIKRENPGDCQLVYDRSKDLGFVVVCLNSSTFVKKGTADEKRGRIGLEDLDRLKNDLDKIDPANLANSIRIALIHHHPVLIPALAEPNRGYDAVVNSEELINTLKDYGFHLVLHGHKHNPHTFTEDIKPAYHNTLNHPLLVVAGGSIGSKELPSNPYCLNSYNKIKIKWHPKGKQTRIRVETRGLKLYDEKGKFLLPTRWKWVTMDICEKHFYGAKPLPKPKENTISREFKVEDGPNDAKRVNVYRESRGNLPVIHTLPSLEPDQAYEATIWIVQHQSNSSEHKPELPQKVIYSGGENFDIVEVVKENDPTFTGSLSYYGPALIQVQMIFEDGHEFFTHIYAQIPNEY